MSTIKMLDDRILTLKKEQAIVAATFDQLQAQLRQSQTRYAQLSGAIAELQELKQSINGSESE